VESEKLRLWRLFILGRSAVTGVFWGLLALINGLLPPYPLRPLLVLAGVQFFSNAIYLYLWKRRDIAFLGYLSFSLEIVLITLLAYFLGPDGHAFVLAYLWPIIMGGWLIGRQSIPPLTALSAVAYAIRVLLERRGLVVTERVLAPDGTSLALVLSLPYLAFISLLVWLMTTEMEQSEENLKVRNEELRRINAGLSSLVSAGEELLGCLDLRQLLSFALLQIEKIAGCSRAAIYTKQSGVLNLQQQRGLPPSFEAKRKRPLLSEEQLNAAGKQPGSVTIVQETLETEESYALTIPEDPTPRALTHIALRSPRGLQGLLTLVSPATGAFEPDEVHILQVLGHQLGIALENAQLFDDLQHDRNLLRSILANMVEGVFVADGVGNVLLANRAAGNLLHIQEGEPLPLWFRGQIVKEKQEETLLGARQPMELDGKVISISTAELAAGEGVPASTIYVARDTTQEAQVERMKSDFVAYVSHELRTPLTTIKMLVRLLLMDTPKETKPHEYLTVINTQVERQARLVNNLLDITRLEAGKYELPLEPVDPHRVLQGAVSACRPLLEEKKLRIDVSYDGIPDSITSNGGGLEQVLINLLTNAVKFTSKGGCISVSCRGEGGQVCFAVRDSGTGMSPEQLGRIFTKFYTVRNPQKKGEGTGLGLVISDMIVKKLGGRIEVTSEVNVGSCFVVRLPVAPMAP
jgi:signal transduction histidine kinase